MKKRIIITVFLLLLFASLAVSASAEGESIRITALNPEKPGLFRYSVEATVSPELAAQGYCFGIEYGTDSSFNNRHRDTNTVLFNDVLTAETMSFTRYSISLAPGVQYYFRPVLMDRSRQTVVIGATISCTIPEDYGPFETISPNEVKSSQNRIGNWLQMSFSAPEAGVYSLVGSSGSELIECQYANGNILMRSQQGSPSETGHNVSFYAHAGETFYFFCHAFNEPTEVLYRLVPGGSGVSTLSLNTSLRLNSSEMFRFIAPADGYFNFAYENAVSSGYNFQQLDPRTGSWSSMSLPVGMEMKAGETVYLRPNYNQQKEGQLNIVATQAGTEGSVELVSIGNVQSGGWLSYSVEMSATAALAEKGYGVGLEVCTSPDFKSGPRSRLFSTMNRGFNEAGVQIPATVEMQFPCMAPNVTYYARAILGNMDTHERYAVGTKVLTLSASASQLALSELHLSELASGSMLYASFTAPEDGLYALCGSGCRRLDVFSEGGWYLASENQPSISSIYCACFQAIAGETVILRGEGDGSSQYELVSVETVVPALTLDMPYAADSKQTLRFTAPHDGSYVFTFEDGNNFYVIQRFDFEVCSWYGANPPISCQLDAGETVLLRMNYDQQKEGQLSIVAMQAETETITWSVDSTGTLTISGTGAMEDYDSAAVAPWAREDIRTVVIEEGVTHVGANAFADCNSLTSVTIPDSVISIGRDAFSGCQELASVHINSLAAWCGIDFSETSSNPLRDAHNLYIGDNLIQELMIPDGVTSVGNHAFQFCNSLTHVTIPDSVISIGDYAFCYCDSLTSVTIPDSVTSIGNEAFAFCTKLTSVKIPNSVINIGSRAFSFSGLTNVTISDSITSIADWAFEYCGRMESVIIPDGVTSIEYGAFSCCDGLKSVTIPDSVTSIGDSAFEECNSLINVYYKGTEAMWDEITIGEYNDSLSSATIHFAVTIPDPDFILPVELTKIEDEAFSCVAFTYVKIPDTTISIGYHAFAECPNLAYIYIPAQTTQIDDQAFGDTHNLTILGKPGSTAEAYAAAHGFSFVPAA